MTGGSLHGDFSSFRPSLPPGSDLLQQQGRVQLDADWNQQVTAASERLATALGDVLGRGVAPLLDPGFHIRPAVALGFDGDGAAVAPDPARHRREPVRDLTIETWVRWFGVEGSVLATEGGEGGWSLRVASDGRPALSRSFRTGGGVRWTEVAGERAVPIGAFVRLVVVVRGSVVRFHLGSEEAGIVTFPDLHPSEVTEGRVLIGAGAGPHRRPPFVGEVAGVRLWSEARSDAHLRVEAGPDPFDAADAPAALLAWWPMDDGAGSSARDVMSSHPAIFAGRVPPRWRLVDLDIAPGRYYVDGVAVSLPEGVRLSAQPAAPHQAVPSAAGEHLVYLETWSRTVLPVQDPALREVALGGADTTVRQDVVAAVRTCRLDPDGRGPDLRRRGGTTGALRARGRSPEAGNALYRIEVVASGSVDDAGVTAPAPRVAVLGLDARSGLLHVSDGEVALGPGDPVVLEAGGGALWCGATVVLGSSRWIVVDVAPATLETLGSLGRLTVRRLVDRPTFAWS
ncbi:MAG TPA: LamG-like jellyroll fold domain-containing protein, partial [Iamia sp.]|nr:LamG-like jellyroll fold domain-containing protein [Iamia sp.]